MKKNILVAITLFGGFSSIYTMQKQSLLTPQKGSAIVYEFTFRDALKASAILSAPMAIVLSGTYAYDYGLSLPISMCCSLGTTISYGVILKALLYPTKKVRVRNISDL